MSATAVWLVQVFISCLGAIGAVWLLLDLAEWAVDAAVARRAAR